MVRKGVKPLPAKDLGPEQAQPKEEDIWNLLVQAKRSPKRKEEG